MPLASYHKETEHKMNKTIDVLHQEFSNIRTGTASTSLVEYISVDCYGSGMPINQLATVSTPEAKTITIQPWDVSNLGEIEKAIMKSDLGLMPNNDGKVIRITIPPLSEERRKELIKVVGKLAEESKVAIRNVRRDANDHIKKMQKNKEITEDDEKDALDDIQKLTDDYIKKINQIMEYKEAEMMVV